MKNITAAVLFALCSNVLAVDLPDLGEPAPGRYELSGGQIAAETTYIALWYVDYRQTRQVEGWCDRNTAWRRDSSVVTKHGDGSFTSSDGGHCDMHESNPLLGRHPSGAKIRNYFVGGGIAHVLVTKALPTEYRPYWIGAGIAVQLYTVIKNRQLGYSVNF